MDPEELRALEEVSQKNNARDGISGALFFDEKHFIQLLEGEHDALARCFLRIAQSPAHKDISVLVFSESDVRLFGHWSMRFADAIGRSLSLAGHARRIANLEIADRVSAVNELFLSAG